ncbi:MAG: DUF4340 domain-containing protein [Pseudomonadota bacterium]
MSLFKGQIVHLALLGASAVVALGVWTRDEDQAKLSLKPTEVEVWGGNPDSVTSISYETGTRKLRIDPKKDALGRWYVGTVEKDKASAVAPHAPGADAGAPAPPAERETVHFIAVKAADDLVKTLAPLHALRAVGKVEGSRVEEFGLDKPEGTLKVTVAGKEQTLLIGGATPGGSERYAKAGTGDVFAISGDIVSGLQYAEMRLPERDLHEFKQEDVTRVKVSKGGKSRILTRLADKKDGWADSATPSKLDETVGNWVSKLGRLHVQDWVEKPSAPVSPESSVVTVDYFAGSKPLGTLELYKVPGAKGNDYLAKTEYSRWYARVVTSSAEQVEQDLASVVK